MTNNKSNMLRILTVFICIALSVNRMSAQNTFSETLEIHLNAIRNADLVSFDSTVADSLIQISPMGQMNQSRAEFIKLHQEWFERTNWEWEGVVLEERSDSSFGYALIEYSYIEKDATGNVVFRTRCYLTLIFKKSDRGWKLVYDQNTTIPD